ncbi:MAG: hypothetical protein IKC74_00750 [Clostridia bacterium]|nr:hypothetical protein [Clostridia bacterium]
MQFKCLDCNSILEEEELTVSHEAQSHPYGEGFAIEDVSECFCPFCDSTEIEIIF